MEQSSLCLWYLGVGGWDVKEKSRREKIFEEITFSKFDKNCKPKD